MHHFPTGEDERHFPCAGCHCQPYEQAKARDDGEIVWEWFHETLGERRRRRLTGTLE